MAYAALVSLSQVLADQVTDVDQQQNKSLHEKLCSLQSFMEDYANNTGEKGDPLEERIREAAYQAEDVIEAHILNRVRSERSLAFRYGQMQNLEKRYKKDLMRMNEKFDSIVEEATKIKPDYEVETPIPRYSVGAGSSREAPIRLGSMGFHDDLQEMKDRLCGDSPKLQIISIVGMGGIGKTTLARNVFDDSLIAEHFDFHAWITIAKEYYIRDILLSLLNSLNALTSDLSQKSDQVLAVHVYRNLREKRYLIVMDDAWSTKAWDDIKRIFPDDNNGSRVIMTTRLSEVAIYADSSSPLHYMQLLDEDQSWGLLQHKVFVKEICPSELQQVGKVIAQKCRGLPLAIVLVSGLVSKIVREVYHWEKFAENVSSALTTDDEHLLKILSLSYNNLPHHLRACFLYMGSFPEDSEIPISKLTMLWAAEGFLKPSTSKTSEEVAVDFVEDLVKRNLITITQKSSNGRSRFCRIHDLLRDFCIRKACDENFLHVKKKGDASQSGLHYKRRLCNLTNRSIPTKTSDSFVRCLLFSNNSHQYMTSLAISSRLLRVLDGPNACLTCIPAAVTGLIHLRYLAFSHDNSVKFVVPATILKLRNLQTLIIGPLVKYSLSLHFLDEPRIYLPPEIRKMPKLRHLVMNNCCFSRVPFSTNTDGKVSFLKTLQTLSKVANFSFMKESIAMIPNLKKLGLIYHVEEVNRVIKWSKYHLDNLHRLHQLESLSITCKVLATLFPKLRSSFPQNFALPLKLKKLTLSGCRVSQRNLNTIGQSPNLEVLRLRHTTFQKEEWKCSEGEFLRLKYLLMDALDVEHWQVERTHFPSLEHLIIHYCWKLKAIPSEIGETPTLEYMEVISVVESVRASALRIQEEQRSLGNDSLRVHILLP